MGTGGRLLRRLRASVSDTPTGFAWVEDRSLAASGYPASRGQLQWLVGRGITAVLTLTPDPLPKGATDGLDLELMHLPMQDHQAPSAATLDAGAGLVKEQLARKKVVLVHCLAGEGRTGCVLAAYLINARGMPAEEALRLLREVKPAFVERGQEKALFEYAESLGHAPR